MWDFQKDSMILMNTLHGRAHVLIMCREAEGQKVLGMHLASIIYSCG